VKDIKKRNADADPKELRALIDKATQEVRADIAAIQEASRR
jgi:hypothetical protein